MALSGVLNQFIETFKKLSTLQRASLLAAAVAVFASVVVLVLWANKPVYKTLYADMSEQDLDETRAALDGKKVSYKLINGNTIEVPAQDVYATRIALAIDGIPKAQTTGFELFDEQKMGMTEFNQTVNYQRALQGELSRSITTLDEVIEAKVHLFIPKDRIFIQEDDEAKASVVVRMLPGRNLRQQQVKAIAHLIASSVKGLSPEQVQILDTNGNLLSEFMTDTENSTLVSQTQREYQRQVEKDIEQKVQSMLATTLGADKFVARVNVEMDFNKKEIMREQFEGDPIVRSQHTLEENSRNIGKGPAGVPGVEPNLAEPDILIDSAMSEYSKTEETTNYEISKTVTHEQKSGGAINRLTVSVIVDDKPEVSEDNGVQAIIKQPRSDEELEKIRAAVASAVGFNAERGDSVEITNLSFDTSAGASAIDAAAAAAAKREQVMLWVSMGAKYLAAIIIILLFYLLLLRPILKRLDNAKELDEELLGESAIDAQLASLDIAVGGDSGFPKTVEELEREIESELNESVPVDVEAVKSKVMLKKIEEAANEDPEMIANLVKALIKGG